MKTAVAITREIDDLELAARELAAQIREKLTLGRNSVGIVFCDADVDVAGLGERLHASLGMDVAGVTTTATVERHSGYNDMGAVLTVLTADDVSFSIGCTGELEEESFRETIRTTYAHARAPLSDDPKLILTLAPYIPAITSENYVEILDDASGGVPVFGGVATDHYDLQFQKTFLNGQAFTRGLIFLLLSGNVRPVFAMQHHFGASVEKKGVITESSGNLVHKVDDLSFKDFVATMVPVPDDETLVIYHFQSTPFIMELPDYEANEAPVVRALCTIDHETGSGGFLSKMPEGSRLYPNLLQRDNLRASCNGSLAALAERIAENGDSDYEYSMILISTCNARHLLMADEKRLESDIVQEHLASAPPGLNAMGFYCFGEICPTGKRHDGTAKNRFHNISFALCAF